MTLMWGIAGGIIIVGLIVCRRILRTGQTSLAESREKMQARILHGEKQLQEDAKNIPLDEQIYLLRAALEDLLRLEGDKPGFRIRQEDKSNFVLATPTGEIRISFSMREQQLRGSHQILRGHERWFMESNGLKENFASIAALMTRLNEHLQGDDNSLPPEMSHLARRFRHCRGAGFQS